MDPIDRQQAIDALRNHFTDGFDEDRWWNSTHVLAVLKDVPSAEPKIIHCQNCKWWDQKFDDSPVGYCMAAKHNYYSPHWEIHIQRTYGKNFFCADAEPKEGEEE